MNKAKTFEKGKPLKAKDLNANAKAQTTKVIGGKGIAVSGHGQEKAIAITEAQRNPKFGRRVITVESLPAIPLYGMREVFWTSVGAGDGDDQVWRAFAGQTVWTATQKATSELGTPP